MGGLFGWLRSIATSLNLNLGGEEKKKGKLWDGRGWAPEEVEAEDFEESHGVFEDDGFDAVLEESCFPEVDGWDGVCNVDMEWEGQGDWDGFDDGMDGGWDGGDCGD